MRFAVRKTLAGWVPADDTARKFHARCGDVGDVVVMDGKRERNPGHHRKLFALLNLVHDTLPDDKREKYPSVEHLLNWIKIKTGHCDRYPLDGTEMIVVVPRSIAFGAMPQDDFETFYEGCVRVILKDVLPGVKQADLETAIRELAA